MDKPTKCKRKDKRGSMPSKQQLSMQAMARSNTLFRQSSINQNISSMTQSNTSESDYDSHSQLYSGSVRRTSSNGRSHSRTASLHTPVLINNNNTISHIAQPDLRRTHIRTASVPQSMYSQPQSYRLNIQLQCKRLYSGINPVIGMFTSRRNDDELQFISNTDIVIDDSNPIYSPMSLSYTPGYNTMVQLNVYNAQSHLGNTIHQEDLIGSCQIDLDRVLTVDTASGYIQPIIAELSLWHDSGESERELEQLDSICICNITQQPVAIDPVIGNSINSFTLSDAIKSMTLGHMFYIEHDRVIQVEQRLVAYMSSNVQLGTIAVYYTDQRSIEYTIDLANITGLYEQSGNRMIIVTPNNKYILQSKNDIIRDMYMHCMFYLITKAQESLTAVPTQQSVRSQHMSVQPGTTQQQYMTLSIKLSNIPLLSYNHSPDTCISIFMSTASGRYEHAYTTDIRTGNTINYAQCMDISYSTHDTRLVQFIAYDTSNKQLSHVIGQCTVKLSQLIGSIDSNDSTVHRLNNNDSTSLNEQLRVNHTTITLTCKSCTAIIAEQRAAQSPTDCTNTMVYSLHAPIPVSKTEHLPSHGALMSELHSRIPKIDPSPVAHTSTTELPQLTMVLSAGELFTLVLPQSPLPSYLPQSTAVAGTGLMNVQLYYVSCATDELNGTFVLYRHNDGDDLDYQMKQSSTPILCLPVDTIETVKQTSTYQFSLLFQSDDHTLFSVDLTTQYKAKSQLWYNCIQQLLHYVQASHQSNASSQQSSRTIPININELSKALADRAFGRRTTQTQPIDVERVKDADNHTILNDTDDSLFDGVDEKIDVLENDLDLQLDLLSVDTPAAGTRNISTVASQHNSSQSTTRSLHIHTQQSSTLDIIAAPAKIIITPTNRAARQDNSNSGAAPSIISPNNKRRNSNDHVTAAVFTATLADNNITIIPPAPALVPDAPTAPPMAPGMSALLPPPSAPFTLNTNLKLRTLPGSAADVSKTKRLHWDIITDQNNTDSIWGDIQHTIPAENQQLLEQMFTNKPAVRSAAENERNPSKSAAEWYIDSKRLHNSEIQLKSIRMSTDQIYDALVVCDTTILTYDVLVTLTSICPTLDEIKALKQCTMSTNQLTNTQQCYIMLSNIPHIEYRIKYILFVLTYEQTARSLITQCVELCSAGEQLQGSRAMKQLIEVVLSIGNYMNRGTHTGGAKAFRLSTLDKLRETKSSDNKCTLLDFIVEYIDRSIQCSSHSNDRNHTSYFSELNCIKHVCKYDIQYITNEQQQLNNTLTSLQNKLKVYNNIDDNDRFQHVMTQYMGSIVPLNNTLHSHIQHLNELTRTLLTYYGQSMDSMTLTELYQLFARFITNYQSAEYTLQQNRIDKRLRELQYQPQKSIKSMTTDTLPIIEPSPISNTTQSADGSAQLNNSTISIDTNAADGFIPSTTKLLSPVPEQQPQTLVINRSLIVNGSQNSIPSKPRRRTATTSSQLKRSQDLDLSQSDTEAIVSG